MEIYIDYIIGVILLTYVPYKLYKIIDSFVDDIKITTLVSVNSLAETTNNI